MKRTVSTTSNKRQLAHMTMHFAEQEIKQTHDEAGISEVAYLPLESIVKSYELEIEAQQKELEEINAQIADTEQQLHLWRIRQLYREEVADIRFDIDQSASQLTESESERILREELKGLMDSLLVRRDQILDLIEESRVTQIRHEEAINKTLFATATSNYY